MMSAATRRALYRAAGRRHPWHFCPRVEFLAVAGILAAEALVKGSPAQVATAAPVLAVFLTVEGAAAMGGLLLPGGFLGLCPPLRRVRNQA